MHSPIAPRSDSRPSAQPNRSTSPFHLTQEQIDTFDEEGFLILRKRVSGEILIALQEAGIRWIAKAESNEDPRLSGGRVDGILAHSDYVFANRKNGKRVPFRVNYLHNKGERASLELLGSPEILGIAESLAGRNFCPTYESMVFKMPGDGEIIPWHQDAVFKERAHRVFNIDIYLDTARKDTGALRVIPRSQTSTHNVCGMNDGSYDWSNGSHVIAEMEPGDVLIHDDMVLHGSPHATNNPLRRVVYFEFRPIEQIEDEGPWDMNWADQRMRLIPLALERHRDAFRGRPQFQWNAEDKYRPRNTGSEETELRVIHTAHTPGSYCSADSILAKQT